MLRLAEILNMIIKKTGNFSAWLNVVLVILVCVDVLMRYLFNYSSNWILELEWHIFGLIFLLGSAYALQKDKHVRVDVFFNTFKPSTKAWIDLVGSIIFLIPWCIVGIHTCYKYASNSWYIRESSANPDGLPAIYVIKYIVVLAFILLLLQALSIIIEKSYALKQVNGVYSPYFVYCDISFYTFGLPGCLYISRIIRYCGNYICT